MLRIDADMLIGAGGLRELLEAGKRLQSFAFGIQGVVFDKLFGITRPAGNHLYRMRWARKALGHIPKESKSLRPEIAMLFRMKLGGQSCSSRAPGWGCTILRNTTAMCFANASCRRSSSDAFANT